MTRGELDQAIRKEATDMFELNDGEVIVSWLVVAATRSYDGGGSVITLTPDEVMPPWEARGLLATALRTVDTQECQEDE